jgi:type IV pilus assembly protein PilB
MVTPAQPTQKLGELLMKRGLLTQLQLDEALKQQRETREFLGAILIRKGLITPEALLTTLSMQFNIPHESLPLSRVDWRIAKQFPASVFADGKCFPIRADEESVTVAIADPLDAWVLSAIEKFAKYRTVKPVLVLAQELRSVLQAYHQQSLRSIESQLSQGDGGTQAH